MAGLSVNGIRALERGRRTASHLDTIRLLGEALGLGDPDRAALTTAARPTAQPAASAAAARHK